MKPHYSNTDNPIDFPKSESRGKEINIEQYCDGWTVKVDGESFRWDHNDEDLGTESIKALLEHLGHSVTVEECY